MNNVGFSPFFLSSWTTGNKEMNYISLLKMNNNRPTESKAKGESRGLAYRSEIRSEIDILID